MDLNQMCPACGFKRPNSIGLASENTIIQTTSDASIATPQSEPIISAAASEAQISTTGNQDFPTSNFPTLSTINQSMPLNSSSQVASKNKPSRWRKRLLILVTIILALLILCAVGLTIFWHISEQNASSAEGVSAVNTPDLHSDNVIDDWQGIYMSDEEDELIPIIGVETTLTIRNDGTFSFIAGDIHDTGTWEKSDTADVYRCWTDDGDVYAFTLSDEEIGNLGTVLLLSVTTDYSFIFSRD